MKSTWYRSWRFLAIAGLALFGAGYACAYTVQQYRTSARMPVYDHPNLRADSNAYTFVNPLLACDTPQGQHPMSAEYKPLKTTLAPLAAAKVYAKDASVISVYFRDLDRGRWALFGGDEQYFPASLSKIPLMIAYLKLIENDSKVASQRITYTGEFDDNAKETTKPEKSLKPGGSYTIEELIRSMIVYSDNNATHLLYEHLEPNALTEVYAGLGINPPKAGEDLDSMTVRSYSYFFRVLYNATFLSRESSEKALTLLSLSDFKDGLRGELPAGVTVAGKFGESEIYAKDDAQPMRELHDCGIVYHAKDPYLLCIMTKGNDFSGLKTTIQDISKLVYDTVSGPNY